MFLYKIFNCYLPGIFLHYCFDEYYYSTIVLVIIKMLNVFLKLVNDIVMYHMQKVFNIVIKSAQGKSIFSSMNVIND